MATEFQKDSSLVLASLGFSVFAHSTQTVQQALYTVYESFPDELTAYVLASAMFMFKAFVDCDHATAKTIDGNEKYDHLINICMIKDEDERINAVSEAVLKLEDTALDALGFVFMVGAAIHQQQAGCGQPHFNPEWN